MGFNGIDFLIASFVHATTLARGVDSLETSALSTVPEADMRAVLDYGTLLHKQVEGYYRSASTVRWPATSRVLVADALGGAMDATQRLAREARESLSHAHSGEVKALRGGMIVVGVKQMFFARELLEIIAGERTIAESVLDGMDQAVADSALKLTPVIGEIMMVFEAAVGRRVVNLNEHLTASERVISGLAVLMPHALGYAASKAATGVAKAVVISRRALRIAMEAAKVYRVLDSPISARLLTQLAVGLRTISEAEFKEFLELLVLVIKNATLTANQRTRLGYFMFRMSARARQALWLAHIEKELGKKLSGVQLMRNAQPSSAELDVLRKYNGLTGKPVVLLPTIQPAQYPGGAQAQGGRHPDGVLEGELFDLLISSTKAELEEILGSFEKKDSQATKVLLALTEAKFGIQTVRDGLHEVWANPRILNIDTIILFDGVTAITHTRPSAYIPPFAVEALRLLADRAGRMVSIVQQTETEPL